MGWMRRQLEWQPSSRDYCMHVCAPCLGCSTSSMFVHSRESITGCLICQPRAEGRGLPRRDRHFFFFFFPLSVNLFFSNSPLPPSRPLPLRATQLISPQPSRGMGSRQYVAGGDEAMWAKPQIVKFPSGPGPSKKKNPASLTTTKTSGRGRSTYYIDQLDVCIA